MKLSALVGIATLLLASTAAHATIIGVAVEGVGSDTQVGMTNPDGSIKFYAPLSGNEVYGESGGGMSSDSCYYPSTCTGGTLDMTLKFDGLGGASEGILGLFFQDLDLAGVNDPWFFFESLRVADANDVTLFDIGSVADAWALLLANNSVQLLLSFVDIINDPFFLQLSFSTDFSRYTPYGWYGNTYETMLAVLEPVSVPEPTTLSLLGAGLVAVGLAGRRRKAAKAA